MKLSTTYRLKEFSETPSSRLSIEEFENVDLGEEEDPPAFKALKIKNKSREVDNSLITRIRLFAHQPVMPKMGHVFCSLIVGNREND